MAQRKSSTKPLNAVRIALLADLFSEGSGTSVVRFRAKHENHRGDIDFLQNAGYIEQNDRVYSISLIGLAAIRKSNQRAESLLYLCNHIYSVLQGEYRRDPERQIPLKSLPALVDMPEADVRRAVPYLFQAYSIWSSRSGDWSSDTAFVLLSENVLDYGSFDAVIEKQRAAREQGPSMSAFEVYGAPRKPAAVSAPPVPDWLDRLPMNVRKVLQEVYVALSQDLRALPAMGLRAVLDLVMNDLVGDKGGFAAKLNVLVADKHITESKKRILEDVLEVGHASAHRGHLPAARAVRDALTIVENVVYELVVMPAAAKKLRASAPARRR